MSKKKRNKMKRKKAPSRGNIYSNGYTVKITLKQPTAKPLVANTQPLQKLYVAHTQMLKKKQILECS
jgi:hypothetical protein